MSTTSSPPPPAADGSPSSTAIVTSANPTPPSEAPRKFPAPCWTQEETLALINVYQDKWYSLRRRNLRSADWDAVAAEVASRCPEASPAKTSAQCRHKMEKLRKRYRTDKQRASSLPNHRAFSSSWIFFDLMDSMETGSSVSNNNSNFNSLGSGLDPNSQNGYSLKAVKNQSSEDRFSKFDEFLKGKTSFKEEFGGSAGKNVAVPIKVKLRSYGSHQGFGSNIADEDDDDDDDDFGIRNSGYGMKSRYSDTPDSNYGTGDAGYGSRGFNGKNSLPRKNTGKFDASYDAKFDPKFSNGVYKRGGGGIGVGGDDGGAGAKRGTDPIAEMASSIKLLGEGFVKMEKMKMEMVREIESMRMEMEVKRSEMILESQQLIVNAFVEGLIQRKKRKVNVIE